MNYLTNDLFLCRQPIPAHYYLSIFHASSLDNISHLSTKANYFL